MRNQKKINILIIILAIILIVTGVTIGFISMNKNKEDNPTPSNNEVQKELTAEEKGNRINDLMIIGLDLYNNDKYKEFDKNSDSMYYATLGDLKELGYNNVEELLIGCSDTDRIIFFDSEHPEKYSSNAPILINIDCRKK